MIPRVNIDPGMFQVMRWFKTEFFSWVDCKACDVCGSPSQSGPPLNPTPEDVAAGANRVENHMCPVCGRLFITDTHEQICVTSITRDANLLGLQSPA